MMKKQFLTATVLAGILAGNSILFATQATAMQTTQKSQAADRYLVIDLSNVSLAQEETDPEASTMPTEETLLYYLDLSEELPDSNVARIASLDTLLSEDLELDSLQYAVTDIRMEGAVIAGLLSQNDDFADYASLDLFEVTSLQPTNELGLYELLFQLEEGAEVVHYGTGMLLDGSPEELNKTQEDSYVNEFGEPAFRLESMTNHWLVVHLIPTSAQAESDEATTKEETASKSLETMVEEESPTKEYAKSPEKPSSAKEPEKPSNVPETTKPASSKPASPTKAPETASTVAPNATPAATPTSPAPSTVAPTTESPTTAHTHTWVAVTGTVHHDAVTSQVWKEDSAAWDETVVTKAAWDESILVSDAWDEPVYGECETCNVCGYVFPAGSTGDDIDYHALIDPGCGGGWHGTWVQIGTTHHDAVYNTVHHDAETTVVHHEATGHYETVVTQDAWDETITTGYTCSTCGATK